MSAGREIYAKVPVEDLKVSTRTLNGLRRAGITHVGGLLDKTLGELLDIRWFGITCAGELIEELSEMDLEQRVSLLEEQYRKLMERS
jgi:DNA-directed RNA polymerase alpha subunit